MSGRVSFASEWKDNAGGGGPTGEGDHDAGKKPAASSNAASRSAITCPNCGSTNIESDPASGASICTECAVVVEENTLVSSVDFVDGAGGASSMVGQFVRAGSTKAYTGGGGGGNRYGFGRDSRETTLNNGRRRIQEVASRLRLGAHFVDAAHRLYTLAVEKNFTQGRRSTHVVAACLYIACRQEKSQHMLIDFSDALQVNVYTLGTCFLKFRRMLDLKLEIIDPALYIYRFAAHLDLDDQANAVGMTALRIVGRMKRDWIVAGRRPAGICAAALLIASRAHGFTRENQDVTKILRVCGMTVNKRVKEFEHTPSANLTLEQFNKNDIESECDPPVFTRNRLREARALAIQEKNVALLTSGALDDPREGKRATRWREEPKSGKKMKEQQEFDKLYSSIEDEMKEGCEEAAMSKKALQDGEKALQDGKEGCEEVAMSKKALQDGKEGGKEGCEETAMSKKAPQDGKEGGKEGCDETAMSKKAPQDGKEGGKEGCDETAMSKKALQDGEEGGALDENAEKTVRVGERQIQLRNPDGGGDIVLSHIRYPMGNNKLALVLPQQATAEELQASTIPTEAQLDMNNWKSGMPENATDEVDDLFRDEDEVKAKEVIFNRMNKDYTSKQGKKEEDRLNAEAAVKDKGDDEAEQEEKRARYLRSTRGQKRKMDDPTTEEALLAEVSRRKISRKINYDAMSAIFDDSGGFNTELLEDDAGPGPEDMGPQDFMI